MDHLFEEMDSNEAEESFIKMRTDDSYILSDTTEVEEKMPS